MTASATTTNDAVMADTNVLVYAHDVRDAAKHARAITVLEELIRANRLVISSVAA